MHHTFLKAFYITLISLGLALIFNFLFFEKLIGISVFIFTLVLLSAVLGFGRYQGLLLKKSWWLVPLISFFALMPGIRANEFLTFLNVCATLGLLILLAHELVGAPAFLLKLRDYLTLIFIAPFRRLRRGLSTVSLLGQIHSKEKNRDVSIRVVKGVLMALPILLIFGLLFSQADLAFSQFIGGFVNINISERTAQYLMLLGFAFVAALSFLSYIFFPQQKQQYNDQADTVIQPGKGVEVLVFLGLISILFLVFIGFQITYLFGGETNVINAGFTYAEYARRGFWELLVVAILSLLLLISSEKYARAESKKDRLFIIPALILISEVVIVIVSAFKRLSMYIDAYGMTAQRFYVAGFIILLLALFILLAVKFVQSRREQFFAFGTLLSAITFLIVVNLINPDAFIARSNIEQYNKTGKLDVYYVRTLSDDAVSSKIEMYKKLEGEDKELMREFLLSQKKFLQKGSNDWQSTNLSRAKALKLLQEIE